MTWQQLKHNLIGLAEFVVFIALGMTLVGILLVILGPTP